MPSITVRNLPDEVYRALKTRAARHRRSLEDEIRDILRNAVLPEERIKIGSELAALGRRFGGVDLDAERDPRPVEPASFD